MKLVLFEHQPPHRKWCQCFFDATNHLFLSSLWVRYTVLFPFPKNGVFVCLSVLLGLGGMLRLLAPLLSLEGFQHSFFLQYTTLPFSRDYGRKVIADSWVSRFRVYLKAEEKKSEQVKSDCCLSSPNPIDAWEDLYLWIKGLFKFRVEVLVLHIALFGVCGAKNTPNNFNVNIRLFWDCWFECHTIFSVSIVTTLWHGEVLMSLFHVTLLVP